MGIGTLRRYHNRPKTASKIAQEAEPKPVVEVPENHFVKRDKAPFPFRTSRRAESVSND